MKTRRALGRGGEVGDDLEHAASVAIHAVDVLVEQHVPQVVSLEEGCVKCEPPEHPFRLECIVP